MVREPDDPLPDLAHMRVPDDASELDADRLAYYRELLARSREDQTPRQHVTPPAAPSRPGPPAGETPGWGGIGTPPWAAHPSARGGRGPFSGSTLAAALSVIALLAGLFVVLAPRPAATPEAVPLASPAATPGDIGGLLPDAPMVIGSQTRSFRDARPAVLLLTPTNGCDETCRATLEDVDVQAARQQIRTVLVGTPDRQAQLAETARALGGTPVVLDPDDALDRAYTPSGVTLVLVGADGVVTDVQRDVRPGVALLPALAALAPPLTPTAGATAP